MTDSDVLDYVRMRMPGLQPMGPPRRLPEGNLNYVWRVTGEERSVIVKYAPPYIAVDPETSLDPDRLVIEARCLAAFSRTGRLSDVATDAVRPPRPLDINESEKILIMEDVGPGPSLARWSPARGASAFSASSVGRALGRFVGRLHSETEGEETFARMFDNRAMQETRKAVQYDAVEEMLNRGSVDDATDLGVRAGDLGERLLDRGRCLTMGDLWPPSVLVAGSGLRIIDWELGHYGRPLQDVGHWLAHLWMQEHQAEPDQGPVVQDLRDSFLDGYGDGLGSARQSLWTEQELRDAALHFGAEILVRTVGPFQDGYVYAGLASDTGDIREAVRMAARHLRHPGKTELRSRLERALSEP